MLYLSLLSNTSMSYTFTISDFSLSSEATIVLGRLSFNDIWWGFHVKPLTFGKSIQAFYVIDPNGEGKSIVVDIFAIYFLSYHRFDNF